MANVTAPESIRQSIPPRRTDTRGLSFQQLLLDLQRFWAEQGCVLQLPYDLEVGAGTMSPETFLRVLGPEPYRVAYLQPSRRPADGRYGENPNRLYKHTQLQVILKPPPANVQELYLDSLRAIGIELEKHDIKFEEDNWESPTLGAWGLGWQVMLDGLEITQFTYFQQSGGIDLDPISAEITYGLERIAAFLQDVDSIFEIRWNEQFTYRDVRFADELHMSIYNFERADVDKLFQHFDLYEKECKELLQARPAERDGRASDSAKSAEENVQVQLEHRSSADGGPPAAHRPVPVLAAYELCLKCSHIFNLLDARGAISVTERVGFIQRVRNLAVTIAKAWLRQSASGGSSGSGRSK